MKNLLFALSLLLVISCGSSSKVVTKVPKYNPNFDYTPPERANPRSAEITIALVNPVFADDGSNKLVPPYSTFIENMADDFEEMLIAKGFSLRGPFKSRDEMVYGDKKNSDIALEIRISLKEEGAIELHRGSKTNWGKILNKSAQDFSYYTASGTFYHFGNIIIEATDPFTGEKFWKKTVSLPRKEIVCKGYETFPRRPTSGELLADIGIYNPVAKALEQYYQEAIKTAWRHIDVDEMKMIKKEIEKSKN